MKKFLVMLLAVVSLSACGGSESSYSDTDSSYDSSYDSYDSYDSSFTNKYGTSTTKCAEYGCDNYIASSGDTNCCETHSNICPECYDYIDGDAMYCMDCLSGAF